MQAERPVRTLAAGASCLSSLTSRFKRDVSSARVATRMRRSDLKGFSMKSYAPRLIAATAVSILPWPEIITTGTSAWSRLTCSSNCSPSSLLPCSQISRNTRCGRRLPISASAESLSRAVRVVKPSSSRMPATRSLISASSSTIRMSLAMGYPLSCQLPVAASIFGSLLVATAGAVVSDAGGFVSAVVVSLTSGLAAWPDPAAVVLQDPADDGEAKTGALLARRHVRFEQPGPAHLRQADPVVDDVDQDIVILACGDDLDTSLRLLFRRDRLDRLG